MNDTKASNKQEENQTPWILFIPQLPPKPDYLRVKLRRRIQKIGAISIRNALYILPDREECIEDFNWLRAELKGDGADAMMFTGGTMAGISDADVVDMFNEARNDDYREAAEDANGDEGRLRKRIEEIQRIDFFGAPARKIAEAALDAFSKSPASQRDEMITYKGKTWVTRTGVFVDRMASAWYIRRFIDTAAQFKFVSNAAYHPHVSEVRFDMSEAEFTHEGERCTFEVLIDRFNSALDPAFEAIAQIVHDIDLKEEKYNRAETAGVETILRGIASGESDDNARIEKALPVFDGLHARFAARV